MKKGLIITIGREYGSSGREIGEKLAKKLGIPFYDRELLEIAAQKTGISGELAQEIDENMPRFLSVGYRGAATDKMYSAERDFLREEAKNGSYVVVGRCAGHMLEGHADTLNIFVFAPENVEIKWVMDKLGVDREDVAKKIVREVNKERSSYYHYYTDHTWGSRESFDIIIDSSILGVDKTADLLESIINEQG